MATRANVPPARAQAVDRSVARLFEAFDRVPVAALIRHAEDLPRALASQVPAIISVLSSGLSRPAARWPSSTST
jgi:hypothetical protein